MRFAAAPWQQSHTAAMNESERSAGRLIEMPRTDAEQPGQCDCAERARK